MAKADIQNLFDATAPSSKIARELADKLSIPHHVIERIVAEYWNIVVEKITTNHKVTVKNIVSITPKYVHPYSGISSTGKEFVTKGRVAIYFRPLVRLQEAKAKIRETYNL